MNNKKKETLPKLQVQRKQGKNFKDFIPPTKNNLREMNIIKPANLTNRIFESEYEPIEIFPEWPGDEQARNFDFGLDKVILNTHNEEALFSDPMNIDIKLPDSFLSFTNNEILWLRPNTYVREHLIDKAMKYKYPNKNHIKLRRKIKDIYLEAGNDKIQITSESETDQKNFYKKTNNSELSLEEKRFRSTNKEVFKIYENILDLKIINYQESDIELNNTININYASKSNFNQTLAPPINESILNTKNTKLNKNIKDKKNMELSMISQITVPNTTKTFLPSDIVFSDKLPSYSKWISSIFQIVKDFDMSQIYSLIYPQREGVPIFNPYGKYWVKLFHMGKFRKIEIDDRMPCNYFEEFLLPRCDSIEELWPAILTKALLKLNSYKLTKNELGRKNSNFNEVGDVSILYALTGKIPEHLNLDFFTEEKFDLLLNLLNDTRYINNQKYLICYNSYSLEASTKSKWAKKQQIKVNSHKDNMKENENLNILNKIHENSNLFDQNPQKIIISDVSPVGTETSNNYYESLQSDANNIINTDGNRLQPGGTPRNQYKSKTSLIEKYKSKSKNKNIVENIKIKTKDNSNLNFNNLDLSTEQKRLLNLYNPISFKDNILNLVKKTEANDKLIRSILLGKEKLIGIPPHMILNFNALESILTSKVKKVINQVKKINLLYQAQDKIYKESNNYFLKKNKLENIFSDFAYCITDIFFSGEEFNMKRLQPVDFTDLKKKILHAQTNFKLLTAQEKKNYMSNIKDLKIKHKEEKKIRLIELSQPGEKIHLIKIKNNMKEATTSFPELYTNEEILMAKKCLANNWKFPPPSYFEGTFSKMETKENKKSINDPGAEEIRTSDSVRLMNSTWTKDFYLNLIKTIDDPYNLNISIMNTKIYNDEPDFYKNPRDLVERPKGGVWVQWKELLEIFKGFVIVHNPKNYKSSVNVDNNWYNCKNDIYYSEKLAFFLTFAVKNVNVVNNKDFVRENLKVSKNKEKDKDKEIDKDKENIGETIVNNSGQIITSFVNNYVNFNNNLLPNTKFYNNLNNSCFLIIFEPNCCVNSSLSDIKYYIIFDLMSTNGEKVISNIVLSGFFSTFQFDDIFFDKEYYLIITGGIHPFGYNLKIFSDHLIETLTYFNYLKKYNNLNQYSVTVCYPSIEKNKIYVIARVRLLVKDKSNVFLSIKQNENNKDNYLRQFYEIFLINKKKEKKFYLDKLEDLEISEEPYYLIFTVNSPYSIPEGTLDLEFLSNSKTIKIDLIDLIEPFEITDKYNFNKHGIVIKEHLYVGELTNISFDVEIKKREKKKTQKENQRVPTENNTNNQVTNTNNNINTSINNQNLINIPTDTEPNDNRKISDSIRLILEIKKDEKLILFKEFYDKTFIPNLDLETSLILNTQIDKKSTNNNPAIINNPFNLIMKLDLSESPIGLKQESEDSEFEYFWCIRIFSTDNIGFMKDTSKEEAENLLKDSWEAREPGRAEKAKISRKKFLLQLKKQRGEILNTEEENLLNEMRNKTYLTNINHEQIKQQENTGKKPTGAAGKNKQVEDPLHNQQAANQAQLLKQSFYARMNKTRIFPKPENHCSLFLKNFLSYVYRERTLISDNKIVKQSLSHAKIQELSKALDDKVMLFEDKRKKEEIDFSEKKIKILEEKINLNKKNFMKRKGFTSKISEIMSAREKVKNDYMNFLENEKKMYDILKGEYEMERSVNILKEIKNMKNFEKHKNLYDKVFLAISEKKEEFYRNELKKFNPKDRTSIVKCLEDLNLNNWIVSEEIVRKLNQIGKN